MNSPVEGHSFAGLVLYCMDINFEHLCTVVLVQVLPQVGQATDHLYIGWRQRKQALGGKAQTSWQSTANAWGMEPSIIPW